MKSTSRRLHMLALALTLVTLMACGSAMAAEGDVLPLSPTAISVQLNGEALAFTDAAPVAQDGRTFLPVRAVFEAMGAEVSYDGETKQVSASRDDTTVVMTLDSALAAVTKDGLTTDLVMDVAPYAADNRTYVPVRFAAQAFGCAVGWDQDDQTVILVDTDTLLSTTLAQYEFTLLAKYMDYSEQFQTGIWDMDAKFDASFTMQDVAPLTFSGTMDGTTADGTRMDAAMNLKMDMLPFLNAVAELNDESTGLTAEDLALLVSLKTEGIDMGLRADVGEGLIYLTISGDIAEAMEVPANTWYSLDMAALYDQMGMDYTTLIELSKSLDLNGLVQLTLGSVELNDKDADYTAIAALIDGAAKLLADDAFVKDGNKYTTTYAMEQDGVQLTCLFTLITKADEVVGYDMSMELASAVNDGMGNQVTMAFLMNIAIDAKNQMTATIQMDMGEMMAMTMNMSGGYTVGTTAPVTAPPADATIIGFESLMAGEA